MQEPQEDGPCIQRQGLFQLTGKAFQVTGVLRVSDGCHSCLPFNPYEAEQKEEHSDTLSL